VFEHVNERRFALMYDTLYPGQQEIVSEGAFVGWYENNWEPLERVQLTDVTILSVGPITGDVPGVATGQSLTYVKVRSRLTSDGLYTETFHLAPTGPDLEETWILNEFMLREITS